MTEAMQKLSPIERQFATNAIDRVLSRWNLPSTGPVRDDLESRVQVVGVREFGVRVTDDSDRTLTLDDRLAQLKHDSPLSACFPPDPPKILRSDQAKLRANFEKIRTGEVIVE